MSLTTPEQEVARAREFAAVAMLAHLRRALAEAKAAGATKCAERIRAAIKSADGARRHAQGKAVRTEIEARHTKAERGVWVLP